MQTIQKVTLLPQEPNLEAWLRCEAAHAPQWAYLPSLEHPFPQCKVLVLLGGGVDAIAVFAPNKHQIPLWSASMPTADAETQEGWRSLHGIQAAPPCDVPQYVERIFPKGFDTLSPEAQRKLQQWRDRLLSDSVYLACGTDADWLVTRKRPCKDSLKALHG